MVFSFFKKPEIVVAKPAAKPVPAHSPSTLKEGGGVSRPTVVPLNPALEVTSSPLSEPGLSDFVFSESSPQFHIEPEVDPVEADAQEAAILYANAQDAAVRAVLENAVRQYPYGPGERLWLMLFDFYQLHGDRAAFDALSVEFARAFERSPPSWREQADLSPATSPAAVGRSLFKGDLCGDNAQGFAAIEKALAGNAKLKIDLSSVRQFDAAGCERLLGLLQQASRAKQQVELLGREALSGRIASRVVVGCAENQACWLLQLELLQQQGANEAFENLAIDYAVTFEVSPPSWESARVAAPETDAAAESVGALADAYVLEGEVKGVRFSDLSVYAQSHDPVIIDCAHLKRIDFVSAGALLNALTNVRSKGRQIVFHHPHRLVAELFGVVGLHAVATVVFAKI